MILFPVFMYALIHSHHTKRKRSSGLLYPFWWSHGSCFKILPLCQDQKLKYASRLTSMLSSNVVECNMASEAALSTHPSFHPHIHPSIHPSIHNSFTKSIIYMSAHNLIHSFTRHHSHATIYQSNYPLSYSMM
jgi:hypothetical protein